MGQANRVRLCSLWLATWLPPRPVIFSSPRCRYPMTGSALRTISPSSSNWMRSTPWVDGCDGPMESDIFSGSNSFGTWAAFAAASGYEKSVAITGKG